VVLRVVSDSLDRPQMRPDQDRTVAYQGALPLVYVFAASKMEAQPVLANAGARSQDTCPSQHTGKPSVATTIQAVTNQDYGRPVRSDHYWDGDEECRGKSGRRLSIVPRIIPERHGPRQTPSPGSPATAGSPPSVATATEGCNPM
jgi:hypothetical protein